MGCFIMFNTGIKWLLSRLIHENFPQIKFLTNLKNWKSFVKNKDFVIAPLMLGMYVVLFGNNITKSNKEKITVITGLTRSVV